MAISVNTVNIIKHLQGLNGADVTANDVAEALNLGPKQVNGSFTSIQKKGQGVREEAEIVLEDGTHKKVKFLKLTEAGMAFDPSAEVEA